MLSYTPDFTVELNNAVDAACLRPTYATIGATFRSFTIARYRQFSFARFLFLAKIKH
jgi:hypothetical protein